MITFLEETLIKIKKDYHDISKLTIILPSKRACGFLLNYLKSHNNKTSFAPKIISIEEFIEEVSNKDYLAMYTKEWDKVSKS